MNPRRQYVIIIEGYVYGIFFSHEQAEAFARNEFPVNYRQGLVKIREYISLQ